MSKRCPECNFANDDSRIFCGACGAPLDANIRLIQDLEKRSKAPAKGPEPSSRKDDDDDYVPVKSAKKQSSGTMLWVVLGLAAVAAVALWFFLK